MMVVNCSMLLMMCSLNVINMPVSSMKGGASQLDYMNCHYSIRPKAVVDTELWWFQIERDSHWYNNY